MIKNKRIIITGGGGYLGQTLIKRLYQDNEICIYSRDEAKHYFLKQKYPNIKCIIGDIKDEKKLIRASKSYDMGIFAASLKQISACDENPIEAIKTICLGAIHSRVAAEENNFESACFISTDKACEATTIYGSCKYTAEQSFIVNSSNVKLSSCRYGNVTNSTGSVIPLILNSIKNNRILILCSGQMTRFMLSSDEAANLVDYSLLSGVSNAVVVPKIKSFLVKDLFDLYAEHRGLKYVIGKPRVGEKIHEIMIGQEELVRTTDHNNYFHISPNIVNDQQVISETYSSNKYVMSKEILYKTLAEQNLI